MTEQDTAPAEPDLPLVRREGDRISMALSDFDDLIARLLVAEGHAARSWLRP